MICEKSPNSDIPEIDKKKYLVPVDMDAGQFTYVICRRIFGKLSAEKAIFLFVNKTIPKTEELMSHLYKQYKDEDGFLYILYSGENTFGFEEVPAEDEEVADE